MKKTEKAVRGQTIRTECAPDRSSYKMDKDACLMGKKMKGGPRDTTAVTKPGGYMNEGGKGRD